ncbi:hypothetical protein MJO29_010386 [Puccinia striiformis f. sp. tritici]|nr:hypothetical protein MJO29_010386 [Puccinia striiformis f. sp. tritici]
MTKCSSGKIKTLLQNVMPNQRNLKLASSKEGLIAMSGMGLGNEVMFNDKGEAHQAYKFLEVDECKKHHSMQTTIKAFVVSDHTNKLVAKNEQTEKKHKHKLTSEATQNFNLPSESKSEPDDDQNHYQLCAKNLKPIPASCNHDEDEAILKLWPCQN